MFAAASSPRGFLTSPNPTWDIDVYIIKEPASVLPRLWCLQEFREFVNFVDARLCVGRYCTRITGCYLLLHWSSQRHSTRRAIPYHLLLCSRPIMWILIFPMLRAFSPGKASIPCRTRLYSTTTLHLNGHLSRLTSCKQSTL
jgi:hypothetical protein